MMEKINEYLYLFPFEERRDRPNIGLIVGQKYSMLVDVGISSNHLNEVLDSVQKLNLPQPSLAVLTHYHYDHSFAINSFNGITIASKKTNKYLRLFASMTIDDKFLKNYLSGDSLAFCYDAISEEYQGNYQNLKLKTSDIEFDKYLKIDLGNLTVELFQMFSPHSDDSVFIKVNDYLFIGDSFFYNIFEGKKEFDKESLEAFYLIINSFDVEYIIQGHDVIKTKEEIMDEINQLLL